MKKRFSDGDQAGFIALFASEKREALVPAVTVVPVGKNWEILIDPLWLSELVLSAVTPANCDVPVGVVLRKALKFDVKIGSNGECAARMLYQALW